MIEVYTTKFHMEQMHKKWLFTTFSNALRKQQQATLAGGMFETNAKHRGVVERPAAGHSGS